MTWGEIGQLMSGAGVLMTSLCAGVTVTIISLYQKRKQWVDDFRALYAEFWNDKDISQVRRWIVSNTLYNEALRPVLTQRIEKGYNDLDEDGSMEIDMNRDREKPRSSPLPHHLAYGSVPRRFGVVTCCGEHLIGSVPSDQRSDC